MPIVKRILVTSEDRTLNSFYPVLGMQNLGTLKHYVRSLAPPMALYWKDHLDKPHGEATWKQRGGPLFEISAVLSLSSPDVRFMNEPAFQ